jgi:hypothetical protein
MSNEEYPEKERKSFHRSMAHLHKGALHRHLGVPEGQPIPADKLAKAKNSGNPHVRSMATLAENMKHWGK